MKRLILVACLSLAVQSLCAFPTRSELSAASSKVDVLMQDIQREAAKNKKSKEEIAEKVAEAAVKFFQDADGDAQKFALLQVAVKNYAAAGSTKKAANYARWMRWKITDCPLDLQQRVINESLRNLPRKTDAQPLKDVLAEVTERLRAKIDLDQAAAAARKPTAGVGVFRRYGEQLLRAGNWKGAAEQFKKVPDVADVAAIDLGEESEMKLLDAANFWWNYPDSRWKKPSPFKIHACAWYHHLIENGLVKGIDAEFLKKRIAEISELDPGAKSQIEYQSRRLPTPGISRKAFELAEGVDLILVPCPAGSFTMGFAPSCSPTCALANKPHTVNFTKPFWIASAQVTYAQWKAMGGEVDAAAQVKDTASVTNIKLDKMIEWMKKLDGKFADKIPTGYTFRLPTEAEWEYAAKAGGSSTVVTAPVSVNAWGIAGIGGSLGEWTFDTFNNPGKGRCRNFKFHTQTRTIESLDYKDTETDPVSMAPNGVGPHLVRGGGKLCTKSPRHYSPDKKITFRVCLGPAY